MAVTNVVQLREGRVQFQGLFQTVIEFEADYDPPSVSSNGNVSETISMQGARLGDMVLLSLEADLQQLALHGYVNVADTVTLNLINPTAGAINLSISDLHVILLRPIHQH